MPTTKASRSVNVVMIVVDRGHSLEVVAAIGVVRVRVVLAGHGVINVDLVEGLVDLIKIVVVPAVVDFADRSPVVVAAARKSVEKITVIARRVRPSSRGRWW